MNPVRVLSFRTPSILASLLLYGCAVQQATQPTPHIETPIRIDREHPIKFGDYPAESKSNGEEGVSVVRVEADADGVIRATQLVFTSGFAQLDYASLVAFTDARVIPAKIDGKPVTTWANIPVTWSLEGHDSHQPQMFKDDDIHVPIIQKSYRLKVGPSDYPAESRTTHQEGDCTIRALVNEDGTAVDLTVRKSSGFAILDQACVLAIQQAPFIPAHRDGKAIGAFATINMSWRLNQ